LKRARKRVAKDLEKHGYRVSFCAGLLSQIFSISADSIYPPSKDAGLYVRAAINSIRREELQAVLDYPTHKKKEIWIQKFGGAPTDPGRFLIFRIQDNQIIEHPHNWPVEKVLSSPRKVEARSQKKKASSTKKGS